MTDLAAYRHSPTTRAVLRSLVPVICPAEAVPLADAVVDHIALTLGSMPVALRTGLAAGLVTYELGALAFPPARLRRASSLTGAAAERYYAWWEHGPTPVHVQLARGVKQLMSVSCYEQPAMAAAIGYRPAAWIEQVLRKRLTVYAADAAAQDAAVIARDPLPPVARAR